MPSQIQTLIRRESYTSFIVNIVINGGLGWLILRDRDVLQLYGTEGVAADLLVTSFLLCSVLFAIVTAIQTKKYRNSQYPDISIKAHAHYRRILPYFPPNLLLAALCAGIAGTACFGLTTVTLFDFLGATEMSPGPYLIFKSLWSGLIALLITPMAVLFPALNKPKAAEPTP